MYGIETFVYSFAPQIMCTGTIQDLARFYDVVQKETKFDCLIVIDGGTDSLMTGFEDELGTPHEDISTLLAIQHLENTTKFLMTLGFNVDSAHGVTDESFLRNTASISAAGGFLGG